uniref:Uncharacterized protein n=1 Tax=Syphacia muris TaxID=451379 RepID=A0A0N5B106_9BILA
MPTPLSVSMAWYSNFSLNVIPEEVPTSRLDAVNGCFGASYEYLQPQRAAYSRLSEETCLEPFDDGTESLDRREWQQRGTIRGGSTHNFMSSSTINSSNAYYQEGPGVAIVDVPTTQQRLVVSPLSTI